MRRRRMIAFQTGGRRKHKYFIFGHDFFAIGEVVGILSAAFGIGACGASGSSTAAASTVSAAGLSTISEAGLRTGDRWELLFLVFVM